MCHHLEWQDWEQVKDMERRADEERRIVEDASEPEAVEPEPEREPEREPVHA